MGIEIKIPDQQKKLLADPINAGNWYLQNRIIHYFHDE
jgi:hypothetical protein